MSVVKLILPVMTLAVFGGCGYRLAARKGDVGTGKTISVPTFANNTVSYRIEQRMSEAVRKELARTTHYKVTSGSTGDIVVTGEVVGYGTNPTVFDDFGRASQYAIGVLMKVRVTEASTGKVLLQNDSMSFRDSFQLSQNPSDFVLEDPAALDRLAERFASVIVASIVHRQP